MTDLSPVSYAVQAHRAYRRAYELDVSIFELDQLVHIPNSNLTPEINVQRQSILNIALKMLTNERDKAMDVAMTHWTTYRSMRPASE